MAIFRKANPDMPFVIGCPLVAWKCDAEEHMIWLENCKEIRERFPNARWFSSFETDERGLAPFQDVIRALKEVNGDYWTFTLNDGEAKVTSVNRWIRIETGRNLIREYAQRTRITRDHHWGEDCEELNKHAVNYQAVLYVDSDIVLTADHIEKMMEVDHPMVGVNVPAYGLKGKVICDHPRIEEHWTTAGMLWVNAPAFYDVPWFHNAYRNLSDDPTFQNTASRLKRQAGEEILDDTYGMTWVRKDIYAQHAGFLARVEDRGIADRKV